MRTPLQVRYIAQQPKWISASLNKQKWGAVAKFTSMAAAACDKGAGGALAYLSFAAARVRFKPLF